MTATSLFAAQDLEAEERVLGACFSAGDYGVSHAAAVAETLALLEPDDFFYRERNGLLFEAIVRLRATGAPIDPVSVIDELDRAGDLEPIGGRVRIHELAALAPAFANAPHWATIVKRQADARRASRLLSLVDEAREVLVTEGPSPRAHELLRECLELTEAPIVAEAA